MRFHRRARSVGIRRTGAPLALLMVGAALLGRPAAAQAPGEAFVRAAAKGDVASVTAMLGQGADVNATDKDGNTALMEAARTGKTEVIAALVKAKAN